ncbi:UPF0755 protein [Natronospira proteinivora]|uniref:Endolytic murein transglycosylase n=1 Tax=Natronospira proteinivora TaxID=1807133 RepID=A0ABT1G6E8_9GAMM|nr:endolytic transglycosylase MltG [Natronospira proteinivora]MCP1726864.1 UPF0755 protein [Natronospira proteinivora]
MRNLLLILAALFMLALSVTGIYVWQQWYNLENDTLDLNEPYLVEIERGSSLMGLMRELEDEGIIDDARPVRVWSRLSDRGRRIQAGEYRLTPDMTIPELVNRLERGEVVLHRFTLVEGWTFRQLREALARHEAVKHTIGELDDHAVMATLGSEALHPEGWFLPETYRFSRGTTDLEILGRAHQAMQETLEAVWADRDGGLPYDTVYEALILASIIERETGVAGERRKVAGVFTRRLREGMRLQTDPTVIYGVEDENFDGRLRYRHLRTDTPYNTYTRHGLTPTPIAMPGRASLEAAVQPIEGDHLYFVSRNDGSHHFSSTLAEHNRAVRKYQLGEDVDLENNGE